VLVERGCVVGVALGVASTPLKHKAAKVGVMVSWLLVGGVVGLGVGRSRMNETVISSTEFDDVS